MGSKPSLKSPTSISLPHEPWLEKWARLWRFAKIVPYMGHLFSRTKGDVTLIDFGCGQDTLLYTYLLAEFPDSARRLRYIGVDPLVAAEKKHNNAQILRKKFETVSLPQKADLITMFAVLEHVDDPVLLLKKALTSLRTGGHMIITTPSPRAKLILEFLAYGIGYISKREIDEHKRYPTRSSLFGYVKALQHEGFFITAYHEYFECGLNNLFIITKEK